jgi:hypothetical protein
MGRMNKEYVLNSKQQQTFYFSSLGSDRTWGLLCPTNMGGGGILQSVQWSEGDHTLFNVGPAIRINGDVRPLPHMPL